jgi:glycosyltransferase involved in cell wall biosynthesis
LKIAIITGSYPPDVCGVSDYTKRLEQYLRIIGVDVRIYTGRDWRLRYALKNSAELARLGADIIHMQYPSTGYGWKLGPQLMALARPMVVTLHEASQAHLLRRLALYPFGARSQRLIFTNEYEQAYVRRFAPWLSSRSWLIPIGNNVPLVSFPSERLKDTITYFGLIRPGKGLEEVMELGRLIKAGSRHWKVRIIGKLMPGYEGYYEQLRLRAKDLPFDWRIGLDGDALSLALASSDIAYLPFPDGASERRSSLIALLANGSAVITTKGPHTPSLIQESVFFASSPSEALEHIDALEHDSARKILLQQRARAYSRKFEWQEIALQHISVYESVLCRSRRVQ